MASHSLSANDVERSFYEIQQRGNGKDGVTYKVDQQLKHTPFHDYLSKLSPVYLHDSVLIFKDSDQDLVIDLEQLQADIHDGLEAKEYRGKFISIGSSKSQLKIQSLNELDLAYLLDRDKSNVINVASKSHIYHVEKENKTLNAREFREEFGQDVHEILSKIKLPSRLAHSGYCSPKFSGIRYNGPATTMLLTWDPEGEAREISVDITPMFQLPPKDEQVMKRKITQKYQQIRDAMPREIFRFEGIYLFPNPISNQWELTTACYEATNLMPHLSHDTPFKSCIVMCKTMASLMASAVNSSLTSTPQETKIMKRIVDALGKPSKQTTEVMKYGHAFLTPTTGDNYKEMTKKAISVNTAAITHIALALASKMHGTFTSSHGPEKKQKITLQLVADIFWYLSSGKHDVQHFFLESRISLVSVATWARQIYHVPQLVDNVKTQCLLTAHLLSHWSISELDQDVNQCIEEVPDKELDYIEDTFRVPAHFSGQGCNQTFCVMLKLVYALGNTLGGVLQVYDPDTTDTREQTLWKSAFMEFATYCDIVEKINFLDDEKVPYKIVLHVPKFSQKMSLTTSQIQLPYVDGDSEVALHEDDDIRNIVTGKKHQHHMTLHTYYIMEKGRIESKDTYATRRSDARHLTTLECAIDKQDLKQEGKMNEDDGNIPKTDPANKSRGQVWTRQDAATPTKPTDLGHGEDGETSIVSQDGARSTELTGITQEGANEASMSRQDDVMSTGITGERAVQPNAQTSVNIDSVPISEANKNLQKQKLLGWTTNKQDWERHLRHTAIDVDNTVAELIESENTILKLTSPWTFIPSKESIILRHPNMDALFESIESKNHSKNALIFVCESWPRQADIGMVMPVPNHHVMDIVIFDETDTIGLWCVANDIDGNNSDEMWHYAVTIGKLTKTAFCGDMHIQCNVYALSHHEVHRYSKAVIQECTTGKRMLQTLAQLLIHKKSYHRNCFGEDVGVYLTANQLEVILQSASAWFVMIEGPPGSGKTYMAFHICSKYSHNQVLYICSTTTFQSYLRFQDNCIPELVRNQTDMERLVKSVNLENCRCIIIDDGHQLACSYRVWKRFLLMAKEKSCQVYIFVDSHYQNFIDADLRGLKKCIEEMKRKDLASEHHLHDIHRNSRRVSSFLVASASDSDKRAGSRDKIGCSSLHEGHDVEVQHIDNVWEESNTNQLLQLTQSQLSGSVTRQDNVYTARDIAILVDTKDAKHDVDRLQTIFKAYSTYSIHSAGKFPIEGITIDTLDNFMGFDRKVCICITREQNVKGKFAGLAAMLPKRTKHHLRNPKYRTFVASRGVSRVIFIVDVPISVEVAHHMKMDLLHPVPRRMWTKETRPRDFTWTAAAASPALWYITGSGDIIRLVSESGESLQLQIDTAPIQDPRCVDSTPDGAAVLVTHGTGPHWWTVFRRESGVSYRRQATYPLRDQPSGRDIEPTAARWTHDGEIVMVVRVEMSSDHLRKYRVSDGDLLWEVKDVGSSYVFPGDLSVCQQSGHILLADWWREVRVYSPAGELLHRVPLPDRLPAIWSVCAVRKDTWLSGHDDGSVRLWGVSDTARAEHVLVDTGENEVAGLALSGDRLLAVRTRVSDKLIVYNVAGFLK